jgi:hypothetical protein
VSVFADVRDELVGKLVAAGVTTATTSPRAPLPCVLVDVAEAGGINIGVGWWSAIVPIRILTPPPGDNDAVAWQQDQLELVLSTLPAGAADFRPGLWSHGGDDVPGYTVNVPVQIPNPNC